MGEDSASRNEGIEDPPVSPPPPGLVVDWDRDSYEVGETATIRFRTVDGSRSGTDIQFEVRMGQRSRTWQGASAVLSEDPQQSEPDVDIADLPIFLIACRSRPGQSGSPVYARFRTGDVVTHKGQDWQARKPLSYFIGAYSGRLRSDSDLGLVWKRSCIEELVNHAVDHGTQHRMELRRHRFSASGSEKFCLDRFIGNDGDEAG